ncbi:hypothetical protein BYT27DRAFT_7234354 [Phlegmacium glaucopus]|nr:hypothetical protein BYT27DRAFT_7234354 [Phlegmacium glaucopus]
MDSQGQDHPLLLELNSLKSTVARFQDEAHVLAVKLQRHSLDRANTHERAAILERENDWLKAEIAILRANPTTPSKSSNPTNEQVQQLTLSLRRLSQKLTLTEDALSSKTTGLVQANAELLKARLAVENAYELGARVRGREEAAKIREHELELRLKAAEEEKKMSEVAVGEYAKLVRSMEARMGLGSTSTLVSPNGIKVEEDPVKHCSGDSPGVALANTFVEGKLGLKCLLSEFQSDREELQRQLGQLQGELEVLKSNHEAERKATHIFHLELTKAQAELQTLKIDDNTAAKMVARYMQFSQTSTNALQSTLSALKTRHAATLSTLTSTSYSLTSNLRSAESTIERLRTSLDELGGEMMKETYGRRREVALRVKLLGREEKMLEGLRRWLRKGEEAISDAENEAEDSQSRVRAALLGMTQDARILLEGLDDGVVTDSASLSGSLARVVLAQGLVDGLVEELKMETARRMEMEKTVLQDERDTSPPVAMLNGYDVNRRQRVSEAQESSSNMSSASAFAPPPLETTIDLPPESEPRPFEKAQSDTTTLIEAASIDTNAPDIPSSTNRDGLIPLERTLPADEMNALTDNLVPSGPQTHQSNNSTPNLTPITVLPEKAAAAGESLLVDEQLTPSNSAPVPDIAVDADATQVPHICAKITNSVLEDASSDKQLDSVIIQNGVASRNIDLSVELSSAPAIVGPGLAVELVDNTTSPPSPSILHSDVDPAVSSNSVTSLPTTSSTGQPLVLAEIVELKTAPPHPLLAELTKIRHRYDDLQHSFRDCHLALEGLKASLGPSTTTSSNHQSNPLSNRQTGGKPPELKLTPIIPLDVLHAAVSRLDDYTEDVRVEVEIRISDEEMLAKGYEVLLCVPGALSSSAPSPSPLSPQPDQYRHPQFLSQPPLLSESHSDYDQDQDLAIKDSSSIPPTQSELEMQIQAFITGTDPTVTKACEGFSKKLEDVQHDIAVLKRAIHDPDPEMMMTVGDGPELSSETPTTLETGGRGWPSWIRSPSRPSAPFSASATTSGKHFGPSPTFGSIMTSPHRLKHSPSLNLNPYQNQRSSSASFLNRNGSSWRQGGGRGGRDDVLGTLGLRVPMPIFDSAVHQPLQPVSSSSGAIGGWGWNGLSSTTPTPIKQRSVSSTMYMLGLGASPMTTAARSRGTSNPKSGDPAAAAEAGVESVNEMQLRGPIGLVDVGHGNKLTGGDGPETTDTETEDEQEVDVE